MGISKRFTYAKPFKSLKFTVFSYKNIPFANIRTEVTRTQRDDKEQVYGPEYCVSIDEAMEAVTIDAAWQIYKDDILGSLTKNKKADLLILSKNPYEVMLTMRSFHGK